MLPLRILFLTVSALLLNGWSPCPSGSGCQNAGSAYICAPGYPNTLCP